MKRLSWSAPARRDLEAIKSFWIDDRPDYWAALMIVTRQAERRLGAHPGLGNPVGASGARKWRIGDTPYLLLYRISPEEVRILRVHHDRENWRDDATLA